MWGHVMENETYKKTLLEFSLYKHLFTSVFSEVSYRKYCLHLVIAPVASTSLASAPKIRPLRERGQRERLSWLLLLTDSTASHPSRSAHCQHVNNSFPGSRGLKNPPFGNTALGSACLEWDGRWIALGFQEPSGNSGRPPVAGYCMLHRSVRHQLFTVFIYAYLCDSYTLAIPPLRVRGDASMLNLNQGIPKYTRPM